MKKKDSLTKRCKNHNTIYATEILAFDIINVDENYVIYSGSLHVKGGGVSSFGSIMSWS